MQSARTTGGDELARLLGERQGATIGPVDALFLAQQPVPMTRILLYSNGHRFWNGPGVMQGIWDTRETLQSDGADAGIAGSARRDGAGGIRSGCSDS